jgi:hypothetical protein
MLQFLQSRQWVVARRLILLGIVLFVAYRNYGDAFVSIVSGPNAKKDVIVTRAEFRADIPTEKPVWIIGFHNKSARFTYDQIQLEATYFDKDGKLLEKDKLVVHQKLAPGEDQTVGSSDFRARGAATRGTLTVLDAQRLK